MPIVASEDPVSVEGFHLLVGDPHAERVLILIEFGVHSQAGLRGRAGDGVHDDFVTGQRPASPVHRDVREQTVLNLVRK